MNAIDSTPGSSALSGTALVNFIAGIAATGGLLFGYDTGIISAALLQITREFSLGTMGQQIVTSAIIAGAFVGCISAAPLSDWKGRRRMIILAAAIFLTGTAIAALAHSVVVLTLARFILGLAVGASSQIVPIYIAEVAPSSRRGRLVVLFQLAVVSGVFISFIAGYLLRNHSWRVMFGLGAVPALFLLFGMVFLPNSPRWVAMKGDIHGAREILRKVRSTRQAAERELAEIIDAHDVQAPWSELRKPWVRPALIASVGVGLLCQLTGINAVLYYAPTIFAGVGFGENSALLTSVAIGVAMIIATVFGSWAVDVIGRRKLMLCMIPGAGISLALLAGILTLNSNPSGAAGWVMIAAVVGYAIFNVGSLSVAVWLVGAEVYPLSCRGKGMSLVAASHWGADLVISLTTLSFVEAMGAAGAFWLFAAINIAAFFFVLRYVPETRGRSLEEIEASLRNGTFAP
ncbi:major facilitator superfamily sugar transporter [Ameyamaea chiangmaiensis NBRC 103196]|nr:major facilitator superfamily sugar transporter [Ameyamaea chiangmaiensis NBRC 103196]